MKSIKSLSFKLKSNENVYLINIKVLDNIIPNKLEILLTHKSSTEILQFYLNNSKEDLIKENAFFAKFGTINELFSYLKKFISPKTFSIIKVNKTYYYLNFFDSKMNQGFKLTLKSKENDKNSTLIQVNSINKEIKNKKNIAAELNSLPIEKNNDVNNQINRDYSKNSSITSYGDKIQPSINSSDIGDSKIIFRENNNNISFDKIILDLKEEQIISEEKDFCNNFTAFNAKKSESTIITWSIKGQGFIHINNLNQENFKYKIKAHNNNINSLQYFHDHNAHSEYIISLSNLDEETLKFWEIDDEDENKLILKKKFNKSFFKNTIDLFCIFNYNEYNESNSFLFIYKSFNKNIDINKDIECYTLDEEINIVNLGEGTNGILKNKIIYNYYDINYLDTFYDFNKKELYLINCNDNNIEIISKIFENYSGLVFNYKDWKPHKSAFIKEINGILKLFEANQKGIIIWDLKNNSQPESLFSLQVFHPYEIISLNNDYLLVSENLRYLILKIDNKEIQMSFYKIKYKGNSKIRKIILPRGERAIVSIDDNKVKLWPI